MPGVSDMYPDGADTTIVPGAAGEPLEGAARPGHFAGVLTVVGKLFHIVAPDVAFFGEKDYQQLVLVRKMVRDLDFAMSVVGVPTVREPDGLALSSRNAYLSADERQRAPTLSRALTRAPRCRRTVPPPCWRPRGRCSRGSPRSGWSTWSSVTPSSARRRSRVPRPGCWWPPGWAPPG